jgi:nitrate/TMAO reductase-like tetraheme cytochrome c subunit
MKKLIMVLGLSLAIGGVALAKPTFVKGAKCVTCHTEAMGKKTNVSPKAAEMLKKFPDKKCSDCHGIEDEGKKLTCTDAKLCKKK